MTVDKSVKTDVLVVGAGGAGLRAALAAHQAGATVVVAVKGKVGKAGATVSHNSNQVAWQMADECGSSEDNPESHLANILDVGLGMTNPQLARILAFEIAERSAELESWGMDFIPDPTQRERHYTGYSCFGDYPRAHGILNTGYGHAGDVVRVLEQQLRLGGVEMHEDVFVTDLLVEDGRCLGAVAISADGETIVYHAGAVVLATGGSWQMHPADPGRDLIDTTGDGYAMALRAGAELTNMEFMQYMLHRVQPFGVDAPGVIWALVPELKNSEGQEVLSPYLPAGITPGQVMRQRTEHFPFSNRDASKWLDIAIASEVRAGRGDDDGCLSLDFSSVDLSGFVPSRPQHHPQDFARPPEVTDPHGRVRISSHAINGGMVIDEEAETTVSGLFAVGETAAGPHGADRLGGGMVSGGQVFGARAGQYAARHVAAADGKIATSTTIDAVLSRLDTYGRGSVPADILIAELQTATSQLMMVVREEGDLKKLVAKIEQFRMERLGDLAAENAASLKRAVETNNLLTTADLMARAALARRESRGGHFRQDYPQMNDEQWRASIVLSLCDGVIHQEMRSLESS